MTDQRALFEAAVVDRLKESGFLEIEIRTECLSRCDDGYQDEVINAGWHYWQAALRLMQPTELFGPYAHLIGHRALAEDNWSVEADPIQNNEEYFSVPLFAKVDVTFPVTHGAPDAAAYRAYAEEMRQDPTETSDVEPRQPAQQNAAHEDEQAKSGDAHHLDPQQTKIDASCNHGGEESSGLSYAIPSTSERCQSCDGYNCDDGCAYPDATVAKGSGDV